ncbi:COG3190 Flagellar biogenesis protein [Vibrio sp. B1FLJ16]|nr:COG3190 Flagellar biogenesis protein [Vibrio sp. B1FLJ16]CAD7810000.1 COG3190 Flagellar biogenesis protein [Vibrio sp. B1FLJ16]CAE6909124.1 COG3190 Flagellar biogenesis protein [Vibrio sp. B1FLJ16]CAE6912331.1 COG3190 Flagellar biogenesis protein [Vibrio sp. B1FLJ16]
MLGLMLSSPYALSAQTEIAPAAESVSAAARTSTTTPLSTAPTSLDLATTLGSLVLVIGLILGLAWLLKRMKVPALGQQKGMRIISQLTVGPKERIAVIQVGDEQFLIGITTQSIQTLAKLEKPLDDQELASGSFANQFSQLMKKNDKG